jgi:L-lactate dehydrogenase complex protein LldG
MSAGSTEKALAAMRQALAPLRSGAREEQAVRERLAKPKAQPVPERVRIKHNDLLDLFASRAERAAASVERLASLSDVPEAVARYLKAEGLPNRVTVGTDTLAAAVPWERNTGLETAPPPVDSEGGASVAGTLGGVAETGSLVVSSGAGRPYLLHVLAETHIAIVPAGRILATQETLWTRLRAEWGEHWPRALTLLTGPSRTADIELIVELGAHGPRRLHILVVENA